MIKDDRTIARRVFLNACGCSGLLLDLCDCQAAEKLQRCALPPKSSWTRAQLDGRRKVERLMRRRGIPAQYRDEVFESLVYAARQGKRGANEIVDEAGRYLTGCFSDVPDWLKWLAAILSVVSSIVWILLLFI